MRQNIYILRDFHAQFRHLQGKSAMGTLGFWLEKFKLARIIQQWAEKLALHWI